VSETIIRRAATDVGGTFTDLAYYEYDAATDRGILRTAKVDTTPPDFERGVSDVLASGHVPLEALGFLAHGSTIVINAITERKGARTALVTTRGFRDVLEIGRGNRPDLFNLNYVKPEPFVERALRFEITERTRYTGEVETAPALDELPGIVEALQREKVEAVAVCCLHAYCNPANEAAIASELRRLWPQGTVVASHEVTREWREFERSSTTVLSAYVSPVVRGYLARLDRALSDGGFRGSLYLMQSNGGMTNLDGALRSPITMVESGPAAGMFAAAALGELIGERNLIALDIGGTTAKCALIDQGRLQVSTDYHLERTAVHPGYPVQTAVVELVEIGNGGGSIAWVDAGGRLHVGPKSAGAVPGPAAYGRGGTQPTTTDANLLVGRIAPELFLQGEVRPDLAAVEAVFAKLGAALGLSAREAARGVIRIANANMVNALKLVSTNKGYDPRDFALMAFGGGGALHAVELAEELGIPRVIIPVNAAVLSAWGMLLTDLRRDYLRTRVIAVNAETEAELSATFTEMEADARSDFAASGLDANGLAFEHLVDLRYKGQEHTVKVPYGRAQLSDLIARFHAAHETRYTFRLDAPVELVNFHLVARVPMPKPRLVPRPVTGAKLEKAFLGTRIVDFQRHGAMESRVYAADRLEPGMTIDGPAVLQDPTSTLVLPRGHRVRVDAYGNLIVHLGAGEA
jgi:N-methylhydantoinase A